MSDATEPTVYDIVGPAFFVELVNCFYDGVEGDPVLLPLYPDTDDTSGARERLADRKSTRLNSSHT